MAEDSVNELCEDSAVDVDGDCDTEASISSLFVLRYATLAALYFFNRSVFLEESITFMVRR